MRKIPSTECYGDFKAKNISGNSSQLTGVPLPDNHLPNEVLTPSMMPITRLNEGSIYLFKGVFDEEEGTQFTTVNIQDEYPSKWDILIGGAQKPILTGVSPSIVTSDVDISMVLKAKYLDETSKANVIGATISSQDLQLSEDRIVLVLRTPNVLAEYNITISNKTGTYVLGKLVVSDSLEIVPQTEDWTKIGTYADEVIIEGNTLYAANETVRNYQRAATFNTVIEAGQNFIIQFNHFYPIGNTGSARVRILLTEIGANKLGLANPGYMFEVASATFGYFFNDGTNAYGSHVLGDNEIYAIQRVNGIVHMKIYNTVTDSYRTTKTSNITNNNAMELTANVGDSGGLKDIKIILTY